MSTSISPLSDPLPICEVDGCNEPADGLDGEQCQMCWEAYCSREWWRFIAAAEKHAPYLLDPNIPIPTANSTDVPTS